jgi:hypothetical protein
MKPTIAGLRRLGIEIEPCDAFGMRGAADEAHLEFATGIGRVLVSANMRDFDRLHRKWMAAERAHAGIVLVRQRTAIGDQIRGLSRIHAHREPEEVANVAIYLENWISGPARET